MATRNRPARLERTLARLQDQSDVACEIIVVDDGSEPPVATSLAVAGRITILRTPGIGRSAARNLGARAASSEILIFVDDDISVGPDFLVCHARAQQEWPDGLAGGGIRLPPAVLETPFGRFRQRLEELDPPRERGVSQGANFFAAGNMSMGRDRFLDLHGFDPELACAEDRDLALRHSARGGRMVYLPEATGIHNDSALDVRSYCGRVEWGARESIPFLKRHPDLPENRHSLELNGPTLWLREGTGLSLRKLLKTVLGARLPQALLFRVTEACEQLAPRSPALAALYRLLLGIHLQRGHRAGLKLYGSPVPRVTGS